MTTDHLAVCAVDVGTSAVRAAMVREDGHVISQARRPRQPGQSVTFDVRRMWEDAVIAIRDATAQLGHQTVAGIGIAGNIGTVVTDAAGQPVFDGLGWGDQRGTGELATAWSDTPDALTVAGRPAMCGGALPALCWLRHDRPDVAARVRWVLSPKDYLLLALTGTVCTDETSAAYTLAFDVRSRTWSVPLITAAGLQATAFPPVHPASNVVGTLTRAAAAATGLRSGTPVAAGGPDGTLGAAALIGTDPLLVADIAGTTDVIVQVLPDPCALPGGAVLNPYVATGLWSCGGPTGMTGGAVTQMCRLISDGNVRRAFRRLQPALEKLPPGCDGLSVSPLITGSRFPDWRPAERGAIWGIGEQHSAAHLVRATQESAAYIVRAALEVLLSRLPGTAPQVVLAGGTARSPDLVRLRANVLGRSILTDTEPDVTLRGAAAVALVGAGIRANLDDAVRAFPARRVRVDPDPDRASTYDRLYRQWCDARDGITCRMTGPGTVRTRS